MSDSEFKLKTVVAYFSVINMSDCSLQSQSLPSQLAEASSPMFK